MFAEFYNSSEMRPPPLPVEKVKKIDPKKDDHNHWIKIQKHIEAT